MSLGISVLLLSSCAGCFALGRRSGKNHREQTTPPGDGTMAVEKERAEPPLYEEIGGVASEETGKLDCQKNACYAMILNRNT